MPPAQDPGFWTWLFGAVITTATAVILWVLKKGADKGPGHVAGEYAGHLINLVCGRAAARFGRDHAGWRFSHGVLTRVHVPRAVSGGRINPTDYIKGTLSWDGVVRGGAVPRELLHTLAARVRPDNRFNLVCLVGDSRSGKSVLARLAVLSALDRSAASRPPFVYEFNGGSDPQSWLTLVEFTQELGRPVIAIADDPFDGTLAIPQTLARLLESAPPVPLTVVLTTQSNRWAEADLAEAVADGVVMVPAPSAGEKRAFLALLSPQPGQVNSAVEAMVENPSAHFCDLYELVSHEDVERHHGATRALLQSLGSDIYQACALLAWTKSLGLFVPREIVNELAKRDLGAMHPLRGIIGSRQGFSGALEYIGHPFHAAAALRYFARDGYTPAVLLPKLAAQASPAVARHQSLLSGLCRVLADSGENHDLRAASLDLARRFCAQAESVMQLAWWRYVFRAWGEHEQQAACEARLLQAEAITGFELNNQVQSLLARPSDPAQTARILARAEHICAQPAADTPAWDAYLSLVQERAPQAWPVLVERATAWLRGHESESGFRATLLKAIPRSPLPPDTKRTVLHEALQWLESPGAKSRGRICSVIFLGAQTLIRRDPGFPAKHLLLLRRLQEANPDDVLLREVWLDYVRHHGDAALAQRELQQALQWLEHRSNGHIQQCTLLLSERDRSGETPRRVLGHFVCWIERNQVTDRSTRIKLLRLAHEHGDEPTRTTLLKTAAAWVKFDYSEGLALAYLRMLIDDQAPALHLAALQSIADSHPADSQLQVLYLDQLSRTQAPEAETGFVRQLAAKPTDWPLRHAYVRHLIRRGNYALAARILEETPAPLRKGNAYYAVAQAQLHMRLDEYPVARDWLRHARYGAPSGTLRCLAAMDVVDRPAWIARKTINQAVRVVRDRHGRRHLQLLRLWLALANHAEPDARQAVLAARALFFTEHAFRASLSANLPVPWLRNVARANPDLVRQWRDSGHQALHLMSAHLQGLAAAAP